MKKVGNAAANRSGKRKRIADWILPVQFGLDPIAANIGFECENSKPCEKRDPRPSKKKKG